MNTQSHKARHTFDSLAECIEHVAHQFPENTNTRIVSAKDVESDEPIPVEAPGFLYRGESSAYPSTRSSMARVRHSDSMSESLRHLLESLAQVADQELQTFFQLPPMFSAGFLQHYGLPTELLDLTSSLDVAAYFASGGPVGSIGLLCVMPLELAATQSIIIDLTQHPKAERPRRQSAYAFFHRRYDDLKDAACIGSLGVQWFAFTLRKEDVVAFQQRKNLLDVHTDQFAGVLQLILDDCDKMDDRLARWLADRLAPAPFVTRVIDYWEHAPRQPKTVELVALADTGVPYDEHTERENNYRKWSASFPEIRPHKLLQGE